jgi:hypothetical protein
LISPLREKKLVQLLRLEKLPKLADLLRLKPLLRESVS